MAKIAREEIDALNQVLTITIEKSDYENSFNKTITKYRKDSNLKGFRKGSAPLSYIKKLFGKQVLAEEINKTLQEQMAEALKDTDIFGEPLPNESQERIDFDPNKLRDFEFKFDLGLVPEFETKGANKKTTYKGNRVRVSDKIVNEELLNARKRFGKRDIIEDGTIEDNDLVKVSAKELDGKKVKEDGHSCEFSIPVDKAADKLAKALKKKKKGDTVQLNIYDVEADSTKEIIRKYVLGIDENDESVGEMFECEITEVSRVELAELDQELFDKQFGKDNVTSEQEALDKLRIDISKSFQMNADAILFRDIQDKLVDKNDFPLPEAFLKRWIKSSNQKPVTDEQIEREFPLFAKELRWSVIKGKLIKKFELQVSEDEIRDGFVNALKNYGGMPMDLGDEILRGYTDRLLQDENAVRKQAEEIMGNKLFEAIKGAVKVDETEVDEKEMEEIIKAANKRLEEENAKIKAEMEAENSVEA